MPERLFSAYQVADLLGVSALEVAQWIQKGTLEVQRLPDGPLRIREKSLIQFLKLQGVDIQGLIAKLDRDGQGSSAQIPSPVTRVVASEPVLRPPPDRPRPAAPTAVPMAVPIAVQTSGQAKDSGFDWSALTFGHQPVAPRQASTPPLPQPATPQIPQPPPSRPAPQDESPSPQRPAEPQDMGQQAVTSPAPPASLPPSTDLAAQLLQAVLDDAAGLGAEQTILEWVGQELTLRLKIDGRLHDKPNFKSRISKELSPKLLASVHCLFGLEAEAAVGICRGRKTATLGGEQFALELSSCPTAAGRRTVISLRDLSERNSLATLDLDAADRATLSRLAAMEEGLVVLAGTPGSGLAQVLGALVQEYRSQRRDVLAIRRAAGAWDQEGDSDVLAPGGGLQQADLLAAAIEQQADVIVVQDVRDCHTVQLALEAAMAGRLAIIAMRAADADTAVDCLVQAGGGGWDLSVGLRDILYVRRYRRLCGLCRTPAKSHDGTNGTPASYVRGPGCGQCSHTGLSGQSWAMEGHQADAVSRKALRAAASPDELRAALAMLLPDSRA